MNNRYCNGMIHVVKAGDTLYSISRQHRVPLAMILRANPYVDVYNLQVGTEICIPVGRPFPMGPMNPMGNRPQPNQPMGCQCPPPAPEPRRDDMPMERNMEPGPVMMTPEQNTRPRMDDTRMVEPMMPEMEQEENTEDPEYDMEVTDGKTTLGDVLKKGDMTMAKLEELNDLDQILLAKDVVVYMPKKV